MKQATEHQRNGDLLRVNLGDKRHVVECEGSGKQTQGAVVCSFNSLDRSVALAIVGVDGTKAALVRRRAQIRDTDTHPSIEGT